MARLKEMLPFVGGARPQDVGQHRRLTVAVVLALLVGSLGHLGFLQRLPQPALLPQIAGAEHDQPVFGGITAVGRVEMPVA